MARNKGTFLFPANFQVKMQEALDPRIAVRAKTELISKETWPYDGDTLYLYPNMIVGTDEGVYRLTDVSKALNPDYSGWEKVGAPDDMLVIVDSLDSTATDKALSANQGRVLMGEINTLAAKLTGIYSYKGSITTYEELPTDAKAGDVWNVETAYGNHPAGTNYAWTGSEWDALAGLVDLSKYYTIEKVNALVKAEQDRAIAKENEIIVLINEANSRLNSFEDRLSLVEQGEVSVILSRVENIESSIEILNADASVEGSVENKINKAAKWAVL